MRRTLLTPVTVSVSDNENENENEERDACCSLQKSVEDETSLDFESEFETPEHRRIVSNSDPTYATVETAATTAPLSRARRIPPYIATILIITYTLFGIAGQWCHFSYDYDNDDDDYDDIEI